MSELPYSFHLGRNKNRTTSSRSNAKNNLSNSNSLANNGIQNYQQLSKVNNHDFRKYDQDTRGIYTLKGCNDIVYDVKQFYKTEFEEARLEYNNKQSRRSRRIDDYFEYVNKDEEYKEKMVKVYSENLKCLEELVPEFKITNAVVHLDERSPHMHIVGVPVKDGCKTGLSKQANKSSVFTKDRLEHIQNVMRDNCIKEFNKEYEENFTLKEKEKGRNKDIHIKDMVDYQELKKELEINKKSIDKNNEKIKSINKSASDFKNLLDDLEESRFGGYKLNNQQKGRLKDLLKDVESLTDYFDNYKNIINNLGAINENLKNQKEENKKLNRNNNDLVVSNRKLTNELKEQNNANDLLKLVIRDKEDKHLDLVAYLCKHANSKDYTTSRLFKQMTMDLNDKGFISDKEHRVIFNSHKTINKSEINRALKSLNQQMEEAAEEFYQTEKKDDYY